MSLYPPLTAEQVRFIACHVGHIIEAQLAVAELPIEAPVTEQEINELERLIAEWRGTVAKLDRLLFGSWYLIRRARESNVQTSHPSDRKPASPDDIMDLIK